MTIHPGVIGIDVSKAHLDIFDVERGRPERLSNNAEVAHALAQRLLSRAAGFAVFEATHPYDQLLRDAFMAQRVAFIRVNPQQARDFARAVGRRAKNDALDARMLAAMSQVLTPAKSTPQDLRRKELALLHKRRDQLVETRAAEKVRLSEAGDISGSLESLIAWLSVEIARFDRLIAELIAHDEAIGDDIRLLTSMPGVGPVTATTLVALMPELGTLSPAAAAALAGLAPFDRDSGRHRGVRRIEGGRRRVRRALYMAALTASRSCPRFKRMLQNLYERGKPAKLALIAVARKLLVTLNAILRDRTAFRLA
jgi:transposase